MYLLLQRLYLPGVPAGANSGAVLSLLLWVSYFLGLTTTGGLVLRADGQQETGQVEPCMASV